MPGGQRVAKPDWGTKRMCLSCGARFYDLNHRPIVCPACEAEFSEEDFIRGRRGRSAPTDTAVAPVAKKVVAKTVEDAAALADEDEEFPDVEVEVDENEEEDESVIEDASELGEDEDDMAEVMDNVDGDKER